MKRHSYLLGLTCLLWATSGPASLSALGLPESDPQLLAEIGKQVQLHGRGVGVNVQVRVTGGVANLSGEVGSYADRLLLERICRRVEGITAIENRLQVVPTLVSDEALVRSVQARMAADVLIRPQNVEVTAQGGVVSLTGSVASWTERRRATAAARQVQGVVDLQTDITVTAPADKPRVTVPDADVELQLKSLLRGDSPLAELDLRFQLNRGEVTLQGMLPSMRQKNFLRELIHALPGVVDIDMREVRVVPDFKASPIDFADDTSATASRAAVQLVIDAAVADPKHEVKVQLQDRELVLEGDVRSLAQQQRLLQLAKAFGGSYSIRNRLSVTPIERADEAIEQELRAILDSDAVLSLVDLEVMVRRGRATLTGRVSDFNTKARAARVATRIAGLAAIDNRMLVQWSPNVSDDGLKKVIEKKLHEIHAEAVDEVEVAVVEGVVSVRGTVTDAELEQYIFKLIESIDCVRSVQSELSLAPITAEVASR